MAAGANTVKIKGRGTVTITIDCDGTPTGQRTFNLYNTAHIPSFTSNLVSYNRFYDKHLFLDSENLCIKYQGTQIGKTKRIHEQWVLEYNAISSDSSAFPARRSDQPLPPVTWTAVQAHGLLGHLYPAAVRHTKRMLRRQSDPRRERRELPSLQGKQCQAADLKTNADSSGPSVLSYMLGCYPTKGRFP
jgi:hypothetical protein